MVLGIARRCARRSRARQTAGARFAKDARRRSRGAKCSPAQKKIGAVERRIETLRDIERATGLAAPGFIQAIRQNRDARQDAPDKCTISPARNQVALISAELEARRGQALAG